MRCLTKSESIDIMRSFGFAPARSWTIAWLDGVERSGAAWKILDSAAKQSNMTNGIFNLFPEGAGCMIWLRGWGVWPSSEFPQLWDEIRKCHGEQRWIIDAPGHLFSATEMELARGMARLVILFGWDALIFSMPCSFVVSLSHDEICTIFDIDLATMDKLSERLGSPLS